MHAQIAYAKMYAWQTSRCYLMMLKPSKHWCGRSV